MFCSGSCSQAYANEGLTTISFNSIPNSSWGSCWDASYFNAIFSANSNSEIISINNSIGNTWLTCKIKRIIDYGDRNVNVKLSSSSSLNIATKKGNQTLRMFSLNGQLVYSTSFNTDEWTDVNISLPENIFPSGIYILSLVSATEAQSFKVFVP